MANIHVDYQQLQTSAAQLQTGQQEITSQLARLKSLIDALVSSGFVTDRASGQFQQSYTQWNTGAKNVIDGLEGMSGFLRTAMAQHQQLDATLGSQMAG